MQQKTEHDERMRKAGEFYAEYSDEINEIKNCDYEIRCAEWRAHDARCKKEEARRRDARLCPSCGQSRPDENDARLCPSCGQSRPDENEDDITTWFVPPFFL